MSGPSLEQLAADPHPHWHEARRHGPVVWVEALNAWVVVERELAIAVMRDAERFTVDDPRFSTSQILGPSMLSTDGPTHVRHRAPFVAANAARATEAATAQWVEAEAVRLVNSLGPAPELRTELAAPLAVNTIRQALGLHDVGAAELLGWYQTIVGDVQALTAGESAGDGASAYAQLAEAVLDAYTGPRGDLDDTELAANLAVMLFGAIETSEGATANACWHLLSDPDSWAAIVHDPSAVANAVEESLRLEPAAAVVDRYATVDVEIGGTTIQRGDYIQVSLAAANRDPATFAEPDRFDINRHNARSHATFAYGPHACLGIHLARMETTAAITALAVHRPRCVLDSESSAGPHGLVFRKAVAIRTHDPAR